ncbi:MAG TPA: BrnT family toxin [Rhodanobacteraceae bacterium]
MDVRFTWSEAKRESNLAKHELDFADAVAIFTGRTFTFEDTRFCYSERRYITLGLFHHLPVSIVHTEYAEEIRIISFRKATRREAQLFFEEVAY